MTQVMNVRTVSEQLLVDAAAVPGGRAALTLAPGAGAPLKQTLLALRAGQALADHTAPGAATLLVVIGEVTLSWLSGDLLLREGDWTPVPDEVHHLVADDDSVVLLTVAAAPAT